jgi:uncharacterized DUF497 family protein
MMKLSFEGFDWDEGNAEKCRAHGVSIEEIESALISKTRVMVHDVKHSEDERRHVAIGRTVKGRDLFVGFTFRIVAGRKFLRPITARYMHRKEVERYEQTHPTI